MVIDTVMLFGHMHLFLLLQYSTKKIKKYNILCSIEIKTLLLLVGLTILIFLGLNCVMECQVKAVGLISFACFSVLRIFSVHFCHRSSSQGEKKCLYKYSK